MTYYDILKESKIVYEYLIDILDNADIQLLDNNQGKIKEFIYFLLSIYNIKLLELRFLKYNLKIRFSVINKIDFLFKKSIGKLSQIDLNSLF